ncbi:hypothetical protein M409DRAFT_26554 [Zasmidium cellare ATCC 36951]|uniref:Uncharacterized protein n=1 Tax=Zasmidium cellare ATCC 36951 TaxID=1080233 RepID=A0A6A6CA47_ZASCE|nr:uncharacterized protein M409DRAFT_26554 [Zasmidium cellare ATCC 36951]KAF2163108.1 hypothetical protein M409DRAFT_26554 [Zasmidium cellare ATCC 36951]
MKGDSHHFVAFRYILFADIRSLLNNYTFHLQTSKITTTHTMSLISNAIAAIKNLIDPEVPTLWQRILTAINTNPLATVSYVLGITAYFFPAIAWIPAGLTLGFGAAGKTSQTAILAIEPR